MQRRQLLQSGALAGLAPLLPRLGAADLVGNWDGDAWDVALAVADALFGPLGAPFPDPASTDFARIYRDFLQGLAPELQHDLELVLRVVEYSPPLIIGRFARFRSLDRRARSGHLDKLSRHPIAPLRTAARALHMLLAPLYFSTDETWPALGYDGPWVDRFQIPYFEAPVQVDDVKITEVLD